MLNARWTVGVAKLTGMMWLSTVAVLGCAGNSAPGPSDNEGRREAQRAEAEAGATESDVSDSGSSESPAAADPEPAVPPAKPSQPNEQQPDGAQSETPQPEHPQPEAQQSEEEQARAACVACNGEWGTFGFSPYPTCNCRTRDAGKPCRDGVECQALCLADDPERIVTDVGPPERGYFVGTCSEFATSSGCHHVIPRHATDEGPMDLTSLPEKVCIE